MSSLGSLGAKYVHISLKLKLQDELATRGTWGSWSTAGEIVASAIGWDLFVYLPPGARHLEKEAAGGTRGSENCQRQMSKGYWEVCVRTSVCVCLSACQWGKDCRNNWSRAVSLRDSYIQLRVTGAFGDPSTSYCTNKCLRLLAGHAP